MARKEEGGEGQHPSIQLWRRHLRISVALALVIMMMQWQQAKYHRDEYE